LRERSTFNHVFDEHVPTNSTTQCVEYRTGAVTDTMACRENHGSLTACLLPMLSGVRLYQMPNDCSRIVSLVALHVGATKTLSAYFPQDIVQSDDDVVKMVAQGAMDVIHLNDNARQHTHSS
jgi:hypothetical protein